MTVKTKLGSLGASLILLTSAHYTAAQSQSVTSEQMEDQSLSASDRGFLLSLLNADYSVASQRQLSEIKTRWSPAFIAPTLEIYNFIPNGKLRNALLSQIVETTGQDFGTDINAWYRWLWNSDEIKTNGYDAFKADFYKGIDPKFETYFRKRGQSALIRLDEIRWGGVKQDGIPPLRQPKMLNAQQADYLDDTDIVFGIEVNGDVRAYPKRILAWHEMFVDTVGGLDVAGVYCTLCGTVILYETQLDGVSYDMGTSGFLYRSNKLMYDKATQSLWNTIKGEPVLGPLAGQNISLQHRSVVTTNWGEWKRRHPQTQVLSLETGHRRNYAEGVAYHEYFATDRLMFNTPYNDQRLKNKDEVLALRFKSNPHEQLAISEQYLRANPVYRDRLGDQNILVLTDKSGANRVYDPKDIVFTAFDGDKTVVEASGQSWTVTESQLISKTGQVLNRLPYHRAFWFGWHASYPQSRLVK